MGGHPVHRVCDDSSLVPQEQVYADRTDFAPINVSAVLSSVGKIFISAFEAFRIKEFRQIAGATFLIFNSFNVIAAFTFLIIVHYMFNSDPASAGTWPAMHGSVGAITTFCHPCGDVDVEEARQEKGLHGVAVHFDRGLRAVLVPLHSGKPYLFLFALPFHSFGIGSLFTIMMSMTADVMIWMNSERANAARACWAPCTGGWSSSALAWRRC